MKIIFSRKGFDKKHGGVASPIFSDSGFRSLPIPAEWDQKHPPAPRYRASYNNLRHKTIDVGSLVEDLTIDRRKKKPRINAKSLCIFSPDLIRHARLRRFGWLPLLAQSGTALTHLFRHGVSKGDLFLFFGWFRRVRETDGHYSFDPSAFDMHMIFGWLQIGEIWGWFAPDYLPKWAKHHPQVHGEVGELYDLSKPQSALFIAKRRLELPGVRVQRPGGGVFRNYHDDLCLTEDDKTRGHWKLPLWMYPSPGRKPLTYNGDRRKWSKDRTYSYLHAADIGQEFILDCAGYPEAEVNRWLRRLFAHAR